MKFVYDDGGRAEAGFKGETRDCVCRAISIAAQRPYKEVYDLINEYAKQEHTSKRKKGKSNARTGVYKDTIHKVMEHYGWTWVPTMQIGQGCTVHLNEKELPQGRLVVKVSRHCVAVIDGVIHDTQDCSRDETRCVYGYFIKKTTKTFFTFGSDELYPFYGGWVEIEAESQQQAIGIFRALYPDQTSGCINCANYYTEEEFNATKMPLSGNRGNFCHKKIKLEVTIPCQQ